MLSCFSPWWSRCFLWKPCLDRVHHLQFPQNSSKYGLPHAICGPPKSYTASWKTANYMFQRYVQLSANIASAKKSRIQPPGISIEFSIWIFICAVNCYNFPSEESLLHVLPLHGCLQCFFNAFQIMSPILTLRKRTGPSILAWTGALQ